MRSVFARRALQALTLRRIPALPFVSSPIHGGSSPRTFSASTETQPPLPADLSLGIVAKEVEEHSEVAVQEEEEEPMNEFLSRFIPPMREKLLAAYPDSSKGAIDDLLLVIARKLTSEMAKGGGILPSKVSADPSIDISSDLWSIVWEVSKSAFEEARRTRRRGEMKKFLHCEDVKKMYRFASEVGIRGDMLRELRFKWAQEKLEEFEFYRDLERIRKRDQASESLPSLTALPQRIGKIKYKVHGLDLSSPIWAEVSDKTHDAEKKDSSEPQPIMGKCKLVTERILNLKEEEDPSPLLVTWVENLNPRRADWISLLDRLKDRNRTVYIKVAELVLDEESFEPSIGDYAKIVDAHAKAKNMTDVERILSKMMEKGVERDIRIWVILLEMYCEVGNLEMAKEAFEKLRDHGFRADVTTYRSMILAYVNAGLPKVAEALMREMEAREIKPTLELYRVLLRAFAVNGLVDSAQRMFNNMQFSGVSPDLEACTLLLEAYGLAGDADQARHSFDFLRKAGHRPDDRCIGSMMAAYQKKNLLDKALDLLLNLEREGFKLGVLTYSVLVDWFGRLLLVDEVEQILEKICGIGDVPLSVEVSLCGMYARAGMKEKALKRLEVVEREKEALTVDQFERVVDGLIAGGFHAEAKRIHGFMQDRGFSVSEALRIALMAGPMVSRQRPGQFSGY